MNPEDPESAQAIVAEYVRMLEQQSEVAPPASLKMLPYPKQTLKVAILTCATRLREMEQLTDELRALLEGAYVSLAEYMDEELVRIVTEYREASAALGLQGQAHDRIKTPEWQRMVDTSRLVGDIARRMAEDAAALREEFQTQS